MTVERIVRPALAYDFHPRPPKLDGQGRNEGPPTLQFGAAGASVFTVSLSSFSTVETITTDNEVSRTVDVVRVKNPDDTTQHVDVESVREVRTLGSDGKQRKVVYQQDEPNVNREVLKTGVVKLKS